LNYGALVILSSTITMNHSDGPGQVLSITAGSLRMHNSIVAGNFEGAMPLDDIAGNGKVDPSSSNNLIGLGDSGGLKGGVNGNIVGVADPKLGPLGNNGGPTQTHALLGGSLALNNGNIAQIPSVRDQRGLPRVLGAQLDIGAVEQDSVLAAGSLS